MLNVVNEVKQNVIIVSVPVNSAYLANDIVDDLVDSEADVGVDSEHLSQRVFVLCGVQVAVQQAAHHIKEGWVVLL